MFDRPSNTGIVVSVIVPVLESYEVFRRQVLHWERIVPDDVEVIAVDDGSWPPLAPKFSPSLRLSVVYSRDLRRWTQSLARNLGARIARGSYFFMTDIDHIVSREALMAAREFYGSRMLFPRLPASLDESGELQASRTRAANLKPIGVHQNTFAIRRDVFLGLMNGGYDETYGSRGHYGGDDVEFNGRYQRLIEGGDVEPDVLGPPLYVYPEPAASIGFHELSRD